MIGRKKIIGTVAAAVVGTALAGVCQAGPLTMQFTDTDAWGQSAFNVLGNGGPFEAVPIGFGPHVQGLGLYGADAGHYISFCLEFNEPVAVGPTYDAVLNDEADEGGNGLGNTDPLDARSAFLYTAFIKGTLDDKLEAFSGGNFNYETSVGGAAFQQAIWDIEGEATATLGLAAKLLALADAAVDSGGEWEGKGIGDVRVVNLTRFGLRKQDQMILIPLPMPALLGLIGLGGVLLVSRRRLMA